jgi:hypothetical protein
VGYQYLNDALVPESGRSQRVGRRPSRGDARLSGAPAAPLAGPAAPKLRGRVFGRRKRGEQQTEAREAERRALFEELAKRPDTVCPFLGLAAERAGYRPEPNADHRCYAFGDPAPLSEEQQLHVCLERGYSNCPRYLRGVLVIPSEELEALRRPQAHVPAPPPPPPAPRAARRRRRWLVVLPLLVLLVAAVGVGGWYVLDHGLIALASPSPTATASVTQIPSPTASSGPSASTTPEVSPTPLPTPNASDVFSHCEVLVAPQPQSYTIFRVNDAGTFDDQKLTSFLHFSHADVESVDAANGLHHWRVTNGKGFGWSYIAGQSGPFQIRRVYKAPGGTLSAINISPDQPCKPS